MAAKKRTSRNQVVRNRKAVGGTPKGGQHKTVALAPKTDDNPSTIRWSFAWMDKDFDLVQTGRNESILDFLGHLKSLEELGLKDLRRPGHQHFKSYDVITIHREAQKRLVDTNRDDLDTIERFRLGGAQRLYGSLRDSTFFVMWWDPAHKVFPSRKRHT